MELVLSTAKRIARLCPRGSALDGIKLCSATFPAWGSHFGERETSKVLYVPASCALPSKRPLLRRLFEVVVR
jgi:hypothetical protein